MTTAVNCRENRTHGSVRHQHCVVCHSHAELLSALMFCSPYVTLASTWTVNCGKGDPDMLFQLRRLRQIRRLLGRYVTANVVAALVLTRLDYGNAVLAG